MTEKEDLSKLTDRRLSKLIAHYERYKRERGRRAQSKNAYLSLSKAKANGSKTGRKKLRDDKQIQALRAKGLTIREIAKIIKLSTASVQRGLE